MLDLNVESFLPFVPPTEDSTKIVCGLQSRKQSRFLSFFAEQQSHAEVELVTTSLEAEASVALCVADKTEDDGWWGMDAVNTFRETSQNDIRRVDQAFSAGLGNIKGAADLVKSIYQHLRQQESPLHFPKAYTVQWRVMQNARARSIDWLIGVHHQLGFLPETLFLAVSVFNRYSQVVMVSGKTKDSDLRMVCLASMMIAFKYGDESKNSSGHYSIYSVDPKFTKERLIEMELDILFAIDFKVGQPISFEFLWMFAKIFNAVHIEYITSKYLLELCLMGDDSMLAVLPSIQAAAALLMAYIVNLEEEHYQEIVLAHHGSVLYILERLWHNTLLFSYSGINFNDVQCAIALLADFVLEIYRSDEFKKSRWKYSLMRKYQSQKAI
ncbi:Hypothetical predicted protein [Cloeon dipterum]|uniref:Cyclin N-terminal domain-containing protein n=1 Tax=Cloeon dipterum TaxID=197152 RepID=A0A8S1D3M9_9INSE|nr:Hypothetical predicted protein [Cloeon dipterum]